MDKLPDDARRIATERVKWSRAYQDKYGIRSGEARHLPEGKAEEIQHLAKMRVYRALGLSGYARIDVRMDTEGTCMCWKPIRIHKSPTTKIFRIRPRKPAIHIKICCKNC